jgi:hypothetical protein
MFEIRKIQESEQRWADARPILRGMGIMLLAVGAFFFLNGLWLGVQKSRRIGQWVPVNAKVLDFNVVSEPCGRASNCSRASFTFQYEAQGNQFIAGAQSDHRGSYSSEASDWLQYSKGSRQQIRYNPTQPHEITIDGLNLRSFREPLKFMGWGTVLILIGFAMTR